MRKITITLEIFVEDMSIEDRKECAILSGCNEEGLPYLSDYSDEEIALLFNEPHPDTLQEMLASSMFYGKIHRVSLIDYK